MNKAASKLSVFIVNWNDCVLLAKPIKNKILSWEEFYNEACEENRLLILFAEGALNGEEIVKTEKLLSERYLYKQRLRGINGDMIKLGCKSKEDYLNLTNKELKAIENDYKSIVTHKSLTNYFVILKK